MGSNIQTDLETKFKWPEYDGEPFTEDENNKVRVLFGMNKQLITDGFLSIFGLQECAGIVPILTITKFRTEDGYMINPLFGTYRQSDVEPNLALITKYSDDQKKYIRMVIKNSVGTLWERYQFETIKKKFRQCAASNFFTVYITLIPITDDSGISTHANMLVISKNRGIVYWIEPQTNVVDDDYTKELNKSIKKIVEDLGMADPTIINPVEVCPQTIADDSNCMFWTYIIFILILLNPDKDHNLLVKQFLSKYPTKEALTRYVDGFKRTTIEALSPQTPGGKRTRKRRVHKKRRTYRRKKSTSY